MLRITVTVYMASPNTWRVYSNITHMLTYNKSVVSHIRAVVIVSLFLYKYSALLLPGWDVSNMRCTIYLQHTGVYEKYST